MKILWLSWRDIKNPDGGGAEKVAIEVASRFVKDGIKVTLFTSKFPGAKYKEDIKGVKVIRRGGLITCRLFAFIYYVGRKDEFDLIIDEINTLPFFTPLYARKKALTLIHQLAREYWFLEVILISSVIYLNQFILEFTKISRLLHLVNQQPLILENLVLKK